MQRKILLGALFLLMVFIQWFVPSKMIFDREDILDNGVAYKFECEPLDPYDPFRGKYITLGFKEDQISVSDSLDLNTGDKIYVKLSNDSDGIVKIDTIYTNPPKDFSNIVIAEIAYSASLKRESMRKANINFLFDRFYMEESKAQPAEDLYREIARDSSRTVYALVMIKEGEAVLKDVLVDDTSLKDLIIK